MFMSGMRESHLKEIIIPEWTYSAFHSMLEFLYTGSVSTFNNTIALDLLGLADHYTLDSLKRLCENALIHNVNVENCCTLLQCGHRFRVGKTFMYHHSIQGKA